MEATQTETIRLFDFALCEWVTRTVPVPPAPRRAGRIRKAGQRHGAPRDLTGLSDAAPLPAWWRDTAFAPCDGFADTRTWIKPPAMKTGRAPVVLPASDAGQITETARRR